MDVQYINPFLISVKNVFDTMIGIPFTLGKPFIKPDRRPLYDVSAIIGLSGGVVGSVVCCLSEPLAMGLASSLSGEEMTELSDDCIDAIGEIANMVAGGAKKDFPGQNTSISTPSVVVGRHRVAYPSGLPIMCIPCDTSMGRLAIDVALKVTAVPTPVAAA